MADVVNCRRFLAAWTRYKANKDQQYDGSIIIQYQQLAMHFEQLLKNSDELKPFEADLTRVVSDIALLQSNTDSFMPGRVLRASEIVKLQEERMKSITALDPPEQDTFTSEITEKEALLPKPKIRTDLSHDDFKSMLEVAAPHEEKLSTKAIRKRLGLVDRSGGQTSASETVAREEQESIQSEMISLAKQLKDRTHTINQSLSEDVKILDAVGQSAEHNTALLDRENAKLKKQLAYSIGLWTSLWLVAMLVIVFIITYFYMKVFSRRF
ncbi:Predicted membrane protein [Plasmopara halstedii]|uniref:Predicted membrane protein n=1 Tax=Plasmopara halstedii TaxID=4781 RepID=A0A0N7L7U0_PLAHL|nr:Predicted membrane protein [Plasmopara halstedii]CEG48011.1 Predicted membrane protein [Plasmopara halstedii]|eukprot:XP_024584380.1 Predicted membrane protein [Plasmopara halstedii]